MSKLRTLSILLYATSAALAGAIGFYFVPVVAGSVLFFLVAVVLVGLGVQHQVNAAQLAFNQQASEIFTAQAAVNKSASEAATHITETQQSLLNLIKSEHNDDLNKPFSKLN